MMIRQRKRSEEKVGAKLSQVASPRIDERVERGEANSFDVSVVVVNYNTRELLRRCLESLVASGGVRVQVIVVDNGSSDGSAEMVASAFPSIECIAVGSNLGYAAANNVGMAACSGRNVLLLNSDTEVAEDAVRTLSNFLDGNPGVGAAGPALFYPDGRRQRSAFSFDSPWRHLCDMLGLGKMFPESSIFGNQHWRLSYEEPADVDWLIAAALMIPNNVLQQVGNLDERFRIHANDTDLCRRIVDAGFRVVYLPTASIVHHSGATLKRERRNPSVEAELWSNLADYHEKYYGRAGMVWFLAWSVVGYAARFLLARFRVGSGDRVRADEYFSRTRRALNSFRFLWQPSPSGRGSSRDARVI